ncbi:hypothetical protein Hdeb2414_s0002g00068511 [Helianthus debilis subsp. tardiflorus]
MSLYAFEVKKWGLDILNCDLKVICYLDIHFCCFTRRIKLNHLLIW